VWHFLLLRHAFRAADAISFAVKTWSLSEEVKVALAGIVGLEKK